MKLEDVRQKCLETTLHLSHSASARGYIGAKEEPRVYEYFGRYGHGYTVEYPNNVGINGKFSNNYHKIEYYIY